MLGGATFSSEAGKLNWFWCNTWHACERQLPTQRLDQKKGKFFTSRDVLQKVTTKEQIVFPVSQQLWSRSMFYSALCRIARRPIYHCNCLVYVKWRSNIFIDTWIYFGQISKYLQQGHDSATTWGGEFSQELATPGKGEEGRSWKWDNWRQHLNIVASRTYFWKWEEWRQHLNIIAFRTILWSGRRRVEILTWGVISLWLPMSFSSSALLCIRPCKGPGK